jgi:hypothetical protein
MIPTDFRIFFRGAPHQPGIIEIPFSIPIKVLNPPKKYAVNHGSIPFDSHIPICLQLAMAMKDTAGYFCGIIQSIDGWGFVSTY